MEKTEWRTDFSPCWSFSILGLWYQYTFHALANILQTKKQQHKFENWNISTHSKQNTTHISSQCKPNYTYVICWKKVCKERQWFYNNFNELFKYFQKFCCNDLDPEEVQTIKLEFPYFPLISEQTGLGKQCWQIKLLLKEQFDWGLHCLPFHHKILDTSSGSQMDLFKFEDMYDKELSCPGPSCS